MNRPAPRLHVLGAGRAGRVVARRLLDTGRVRAGCIVNRTLVSAEEAADFIGRGQGAEMLPGDLAGDWLMLGLPDGMLEATAARLGPELPSSPALAFHLSGSVEASILEPIGTACAAVHPIRAFADPELALAQFEATWCVAEGDAAALAALAPVFEAAGARWLDFEAHDKPAWHAATVAASNYLVVLQALSRDLARRAGLDEARATEVLCDLQVGALETLRRRRPAQALTGPIERGDEGAVERLVAAAGRLSPERRRLFLELAEATLDLAVDKRGRRDSDQRLRAMFDHATSH
jgi:predicted short-subunit dehydrogenase-like oxidoreductase (DUF2520 family)